MPTLPARGRSGHHAAGGAYPRPRPKLTENSVKNCGPMNRKEFIHHET
nr:MAG TPA_asm: hypothetical protein [Caudoviricetes sp.]